MRKKTHSSPSSWYAEASKRPVRGSEREIAERRHTAELFREASRKAGMVITEDMLADEELLILGKMDRPEFNAYRAYKETENER